MTEHEVGKKQGFQREVPEAVAAQVRRLRHVERRTWRGVADELTRLGVPNADGKVHWSRGSLQKLAARTPIPKPEVQPVAQEMTDDKTLARDALRAVLADSNASAQAKVAAAKELNQAADRGELSTQMRVVLMAVTDDVLAKVKERIGGDVLIPGMNELTDRLLAVIERWDDEH